MGVRELGNPLGNPLALKQAGDEGKARGDVVFDTPGTYEWVCPADVYSVSVVCVGGGGGAQMEGKGGGGGALAYKNNIPVVPGTVYTVIVGQGGGPGYFQQIDATPGGDSSFSLSGADLCKAGGGEGAVKATHPSAGADPTGGTVKAGDGGGGGGKGGVNSGGGAGGYSGNGGNGYNNSYAPTAGSGGGGGGGHVRGGGGGVGLFGQGVNGSAGFYDHTIPKGYTGGGGGSGGESGTKRAEYSVSGYTFYQNTIPGRYGGGAPGGGSSAGYLFPVPGASGAVRIVWPGDTRLFPSTDVGPS